jgi:UDP-N-acetylmuramoylalanine--D-glutamate ligase
MTTSFSVVDRRVVVVGGARSGVAAAELLLRRGARVTVTDLRDTFPGSEVLAARGAVLELGRHDPDTLAAADLIVVSPGVSVAQPAFDRARAAGVETIGELELASRWLSGRLIAITGTKGKSTTTTLVGRMLQADGRQVLVGGNIGMPLSAQVDASRDDVVHVVETSSFQLETTVRFRPWIAAWLNLAADHLDRHADLEEYGAAKARIFANQTGDDWAIVNAHDASVVRWSQSTRAARVAFSPFSPVADGYCVDGEWIVRRTPTHVDRLVPRDAVELAGRHMLGNVVAAVAVAHTAGAQPDAMRHALRGFSGLEHVMEPVGAVGGVRFVNDSKATNVEAARRSIESFAGGVVAIVGGRFKGGDLGELRGPLRDRGRAVVAIGEAAPRVVAAVAGVVPIIEAASMADAVRLAFEAAQPDGVVLLAPACASFDWFSDYAARGQAFKAAVRALGRSSAQAAAAMSPGGDPT